MSKTDDASLKANTGSLDFNVRPSVLNYLPFICGSFIIAGFMSYMVIDIPRLLVPYFGHETIMYSMAIGSVLLLILILLAALMEKLVCDQRLCIENGEFFFSRGFFNKKRAQAPASYITYVEISRSLYQRLVGTGDITVAFGLMFFELRGVRHPEEVKRQILSRRPNDQYSL